MEKLDLKRIWEIMNKLSYEESKLSEERRPNNPQLKWYNLENDYRNKL